MAVTTPKVNTEQLPPAEVAQLGNSQLAGGEVVGVDKIRDLLFGNQMQDYDVVSLNWRSG